jgi:Iron-containing redox enzyme
MKKSQFVLDPRVFPVSFSNEMPPIAIDPSGPIKESFELHSTLAAFNRKRLNSGEPSFDWQADILNAIPVQIAEGHFLEQERSKIRLLAAKAPTDVQGFLEWFQLQKDVGLGQFDPLFDWLAETANFEQMRWFVRQEFAGEAGFDDLVALTQLKLPVQAKLELARNYWDEMGRGKVNSMHGPLLDCLAEEMNVMHTPETDLVWESLALANLLVGLAVNRRFAYHALGALGAIELTSPTRAVKVSEGLERLGVSRASTYYFRLHSTVDIVHAEDWKREVLAPIVAANPAVAVHIAEGVLMRLNAGARCFDRYRAQFGLGGPKAHLD